MLNVALCLLVAFSASSQAIKASPYISDAAGSAWLAKSASGLADRDPVPVAGPQAEPVGVSSSGLSDGWWVIVGTMPAEPFDNIVSDRIHARVEACGLKAFNDFSEKFAGFAPGFTVFVLGAYASKSEANAILSKASRCVPDAYIKHGRYLGE